MSAGILHTCAIRSDGRGYCWGHNQWGQLGAEGTHPAPVEIGGDRRWASLEAGETLTCGIDADGGTYCWGALEDGPAGGAAPRRVGGDPGFVTLSAGNGHVCGISEAGDAYCWGDNLRGQLGVGLIDGSIWMNRPAPTPVAGDVWFAELAAGDEHTCALSEGGEVYCWGGDSTDDGGETPSRAAIQFALESLVVGGTATRSHACGMVESDLYCWGFNGSGQVGGGSVGDVHTNYESMPVVVIVPGGGASFDGVTAGGGPWWRGHTGHTCALVDGTAYCWGDNRFGQLGDGTLTLRSVPTPVADGHRFAALSAGGGHTCGITENGELYCWGDSTAGQLGDGRSGEGASATSPVLVPVPEE